MKTLRIALAAALIAGSLAASAQTPGTAGRVTSVTLAATTPTTFRGSCYPAVAVGFQGHVTTDIAQPIPNKTDPPFRFIWSDYRVDKANANGFLDGRRQANVNESRVFDKSFSGWVYLQADPWQTGHPRESARVAVNITCELKAVTSIRGPAVGVAVPTRTPTPAPTPH